MKIHRYYLETAPWWMVCRHMKPLDRNMILWTAGKALGVVQ